MNIILPDQTVVHVAVMTIDEVTRVSQPDEYKTVNDAFDPFYELPAESRRLEINGIVTKSAMALLRKQGDGATLCHNGENYVVNTLDEHLASPKKGLKQVTVYAVCYFPTV